MYRCIQHNLKPQNNNDQQEMGNSQTPKSQQLQACYPELKILPELSLSPSNLYELIYVRGRNNEIMMIKESAKEPPGHPVYGDVSEFIPAVLDRRFLGDLWYTLWEWVPSSLDRYLVVNHGIVNRAFAISIIQTLTKVYSYLWRSCQGIGLDITPQNIRASRSSTTGALALKILPPYLTHCPASPPSSSSAQKPPLIYHNEIKDLGQVLYNLFKSRQKQIGNDLLGFIINRIRNCGLTNGVNWQVLEKETRLLSNGHDGFATGTEYRVSIEELNNYKYAYSSRQRSVSPIGQPNKASNIVKPHTPHQFQTIPQPQAQLQQQIHPIAPRAVTQHSPIKKYDNRPVSPYSHTKIPLNGYSNINMSAKPNTNANTGQIGQYYTHQGAMTEHNKHLGGRASKQLSPMPKKNENSYHNNINLNANASHQNFHSNNANLYRPYSQVQISGLNYNFNSSTPKNSDKKQNIMNQIMQNVPSNRLFTTNFPTLNMNTIPNLSNPNLNTITPKSTTTGLTTQAAQQKSSVPNQSSKIPVTQQSNLPQSNRKQSILHIELDQSDLSRSRGANTSQSNIGQTQVMTSDRGNPSPMRYFNGDTSSSRVSSCSRVATTPNKTNTQIPQSKTSQNLLNNITNFRPSTPNNISSSPYHSNNHNYETNAVYKNNSLVNLYGQLSNNQGQSQGRINKNIMKTTNNININGNGQYNIVGGNLAGNHNAYNISAYNTHNNQNISVMPSIMPTNANQNQQIKENQCLNQNQNNNIRYLQPNTKQKQRLIQSPNINTNSSSKQPIRLGKKQDIYPLFEPSATNHIQLKPKSGVPNMSYTAKTSRDQHIDPNNTTTNNTQNKSQQKIASNLPPQYNSNYKNSLSQNKNQSPFSPQQLPNNRQLLGSSIPVVVDKESSFGLTVSEDSEAGGAYEGIYVGSYHPNYPNTKHGVGKLTFPSGGCYQGNFSWNMMNGWGKLFYPSGRLAYQGYWKNSKFQGYGKLFNQCPLHTDLFNYRDFNQIQLNSQQGYWKYYEGNMKNDMKQGHGIWVLENGEKFDGDFKEDMVHGVGTFYGKKESVEGRWDQNVLIKVIRKF